MAEALKHLLSTESVDRIANAIVTAHPTFPQAVFAREAKRGLSALSFSGRAKHIADALARHLPSDFPTAADVLVRAMGPELDREATFGGSVFEYWPFAFFFAEHGLEHLDASMRANYELTKRFTAEFSLRPLLDRYPEETLHHLRAWARDPNAHVRRAVSEGTRSRLPWAPRLQHWNDDPRPLLALLEPLRDDPSEYVRRSVANHLNDASKAHAALVLDVCARWVKGRVPEARRALVAHALRTLVKKGDPRALSILGYGEAVSLRLQTTLQPRRVTLGGKATVELVLENRTRNAARAIVDLRVYYRKARGKASPKVFKVARLALGAGESIALRKTLSFAQHTTRTHYPGRHAVTVLINGTPHDGGAFEVVR